MLSLKVRVSLTLIRPYKGSLPAPQTGQEPLVFMDSGSAKHIQVNLMLPPPLSVSLKYLTTEYFFPLLYLSFFPVCVTFQ